MRPVVAFRPLVVAALAFTCALGTGCKKKELPPELVGSYSRSGDVPAELRAELSLARGGLVLTVVRASASINAGVFSTLFESAKTQSGSLAAGADGSVGLGRSVLAARTFRTLACDATACSFELAEDGKEPTCGGTFERVQNTLVIVATGPCQVYSGRWVSLDGLSKQVFPSPSASAFPTPTVVPTPTLAPAPGIPSAPSTPSAPVVTPDAGVTELGFPPDIPAPTDHMSCLSACSIMGTRCHRTSPSSAFLACVENEQICRARCEKVFPFFGGH